MRIICDSCGAQYKIPIKKLGKRVNRATCRRCGHHIVIHHAPDEAQPEDALVNHDDERTLINDDPAKPVANKTPQPTDSPKPIGDGVQLVRGAVGLDLPSQLPDGPDDVDDRTISSAPDSVVDPEVALEKLAPKIRPQATEKKDRSTAKPAAKETAKNMASGVSTVDMFLIVGSSFVAMLGLAAAAYGANVSSSFMAMIGLGLGFGGLLTNVLIALTSNFGANPASKTVSLGLSIIVGFVVCAAVFFTGFASSEMVKEAPVLAEVDEVVEEVEQEDIEPTDTEEAPVEDLEEEAPAEAVAAVATTPAPAPAPAAAPQNDYTPPAIITQAPVETESPEPAPVPEPEPAPIVPEPSSTPEAADQIPSNVVHTLLSSNSKVKRCFQAEYKRNGTPPNNIPVQFLANSDGQVLTAYITSGPYKGASFETCLSDAIKSVAMPPFSGAPQQVNYTFRLN